MKTTISLFLLLLLISCGSSVPRDVLAPAKMQGVLYDMMKADELANYYSARDSSIHDMERREQYYQSVLSVHNIGKGKFKRSLEYYESHPGTLKTVMDSLQSFVKRVQEGDTLEKTNYPVPADTLHRKTPFPSKRL